MIVFQQKLQGEVLQPNSISRSTRKPAEWTLRSLYNAMSEDSYPELFKQIKKSNVLALPQSAAKILELSKNPENGPPEYAVPISADPGLMVQILRFVNSSFFGFRYNITTIQAALSLVCVRTIKNFVLWNAVFALLPNPRSGPFNLKLVFQDALRRGVFCKALASYIRGLDPEELFVAGLFQDMAIPVLARVWPKEYAELLTRQHVEHIRLSELEERQFGWNHAIAGAFLVETWGFGSDFAKSVRNHILPVFDHDGSKSGIIDAVVALSSLLPSALDDTWQEGDEFYTAYYKIMKKSILLDKMPLLNQLFTDIDEQYRDLLTITATPSPPLTLTDFQRLYSESLD